MVDNSKDANRHPVFLGCSIFAPLFELPPVTIPAGSQRLTPSLLDAWQRTRFFCKLLRYTAPVLPSSG